MANMMNSMSLIRIIHGISGVPHSLPHLQGNVVQTGRPASSSLLYLNVRHLDPIFSRWDRTERPCNLFLLIIYAESKSQWSTMKWDIGDMINLVQLTTTQQKPLCSEDKKNCYEQTKRILSLMHRMASPDSKRV